MLTYLLFDFLQSFNWSKERIDETRKQSDKVRDLCSLAEKLGCSPTQLSIAWTLKHEAVQCLLIGATNVEQLHQNLQALQVKILAFLMPSIYSKLMDSEYLIMIFHFDLQLLPRLSTSVMLELERILDNKPVRLPAVSTLALRELRDR